MLLIEKEEIDMEKRGGVSIEITKVGERGQLVIPKGIRQEAGLTTGTAVEIIQADNLIVLKKIEPQIKKKDLAVLERISKAWKEIEDGKYKKYSSSEFKKRFLGGKL